MTVLKQTVFDYTNHNTPVFACFLDIRKAFVRVSVFKVILKLKSRGIPLYVIKNRSH